LKGFFISVVLVIGVIGLTTLKRLFAAQSSIEDLLPKNSAQTTTDRSSAFPKTVWLGPAVSVPLGYISPTYTLGYGGSMLFTVDRLSRLISSKSWLERFRFGMEVGVSYYPSYSDVYQGLTQYPLQIRASYGFEIFPRIKLLPFLGSGVTLGRFANANGSRAYSLFSTSLGLNVEYPVYKNIWLLTSTSWYAEYDSVVNSFWKTSVMAGYRW